VAAWDDADDRLQSAARAGPGRAMVAVSPLADAHLGWRWHDHGGGATPWSWQTRIPLDVCAWGVVTAMGHGYYLDPSSVYPLVTWRCVGRWRDVVLGIFLGPETNGTMRARVSYVGLPPLLSEGAK
jgi:hypothetical protein